MCIRDSFWGGGRGLASAPASPATCFVIHYPNLTHPHSCTSEASNDKRARTLRPQSGNGQTLA
eukprot:4804129-Alexandrium_andersonii.AAC.1